MKNASRFFCNWLNIFTCRQRNLCFTILAIVNPANAVCQAINNQVKTVSRFPRHLRIYKKKDKLRNMPVNLMGWFKISN